MLNLRRDPGQSVIIVDREGRVLRVKVMVDWPKRIINLAFDDDDRNFRIVRAERARLDDARPR